MKELAVGYARVSTKKQERRGYSLDAQEDIINEYGKSNSHKLIHIFKIQEPGSKVERKKLFMAFHYCVEKNIKLILISDSDRWTRNRYLDMDAQKFLKKHNMRVYLIEDRRSIPEATTAALAFQHNIKVTTDEYFSAMLREKILRAVKKKLEKGEYPRSAPQGYHNISKTDNSPAKIIKTEDAEKIKRLIEMFNTAKFTLRHMIKIAKDIGLKPPKVSEFTKSTISDIIKNRFYYGEFEYRLPNIDERKSKIYQNKTKGFEPIITKKMWEENQVILKKRQTNHSGRNKNQHMFNNLITCGKCGGLIFGFKPVYPVKWKTKKGIQTKDYVYETHYICNKNSYYTTNGKNAVWKGYVDIENMIIKKDITYAETYTGEEKVYIKKGTKVETGKCNMPYFLESEVEDMLMDEIGLIKFNKKMWEKTKKDLFADETKDFMDFEIRNLRSEMTKNETRLDDLYDDYKKEVIDIDFFKTRSEAIRTRQEEAKERLLELEEEREMHDDKIGKAIRILDGLKNWEQIWKEASSDKKRQLVNLMTIKVSTVYYKRVYKGTPCEDKRLRITYTPEINELFTIGLLESDKEEKKENLNYRFFNSPNFRYSRSDH